MAISILVLFLFISKRLLVQAFGAIGGSFSTVTEEL